MQNIAICKNLWLRFSKLKWNFEFIDRTYSLQINSQFRPEDKIWYRNIKSYDRIFFQVNLKLSSSYWILRQKKKLRFQKTVLEGYANHIFTKFVLFNLLTWTFLNEKCNKKIFTLLYKYLVFPHFWLTLISFFSLNLWINVR